MSEEQESGEIHTMGVPQMDASLVQYILNTDEISQNLILRLSGWSFNPSTEKYEHTEGEELLNKYGIKILFDTLLPSISHRGLYMSNLNINEAYALAREIIMETKKIMFVNYVEMGIKNMADMSTIIEILRANILATIKRPYQEGERDWLKKTTHETRTIGSSKKGLGLGGR